MDTVIEKINNLFSSGVRQKEVKTVKSSEDKKSEISIEEVIRRYEQVL